MQILLLELEPRFLRGHRPPASGVSLGGPMRPGGRRADAGQQPSEGATRGVPARAGEGGAEGELRAVAAVSAPPSRGRPGDVCLWKPF